MCFGPKICCGPDMGCLIDTKETTVCQLEDLKSNVPCQPYGKICDKVEFGRCATSNLCCNPGKISKVKIYRIYKILFRSLLRRFKLRNRG